MLDVLLTKCRIVDPKNGVDQVGAIGIRGGKVVYVGKEDPPEDAVRIVDLSGLVVMPGVIDPHVHIVGVARGIHGQRMMAKAGVTCAVDMAGTLDEIAGAVRDNGAGLSIAFLPCMVPGETVSSADPPAEEISEFIEDAANQGAVGIKILGGHYPLTPAATGRAIGVACEKGIRVAVHSGTTEHGSDFLGLEETIKLAGSNPVHIAHINAYCRGQVLGDPLEETQRAIEMLVGAPNAVSESYLSLYNGTRASCANGVPKSNVVKTCLKMGGYAPTQDGLGDAIAGGWAFIHIDAGGSTQLVCGTDARDYWASQHTETGVSFPVNPPQPSFTLATVKHGGKFVVTSLCTDGGSIPRNTTVEQGLAIVKYGGMTLGEFVHKASAAPVGMFGLTSKGHLGVGADADVTVLDVKACKPVMALVAGSFIMLDGQSIGTGGTILAGPGLTKEASLRGVGVRVLGD